MKRLSLFFCLALALWASAAHAQTLVAEGSSSQAHIWSVREKLEVTMPDFKVSEDLMALARIYLSFNLDKMQFEPSLADLQKKFQDELSFLLNKKTDFPEFRVETFQLLKKYVGTYNQNIQKTPQLSQDDENLLRILVNFRLFLLERADEIKGQYAFLEDSDIFSIYAYTKHMFTALNSYLYASRAPQNEQLEIFIRALGTALSKIPVYEGVVERVVLPREDFLQKHCLNCLVTYPAFVSTSIVSNRNYGYKLIMHIKSGRKIESISNIPAEREVLIPPDAQFLVKRIDGNEVILEQQ